LQLTVNDEGEEVFVLIPEPSLAINLGTALFRKSVFDRVGLFDETLRISQDIDWFMRAREQGVSTVVSQRTALIYRIHRHNATRDKRASRSAFVTALKMSLDRRRRGAGGEAVSLPELPHLRKE